MFKLIDNLPSCILNDMHRDVDYKNRNNVFHASEVSGNCVLKMYLDRVNGRDCDNKCEYAMYRGRIFDQHITPLFDESQRNVSHRVPNTHYIIRGKIDGYNREENVIYELKTINKMDWLKEPRDSHIQQAVFYLNCFDPLAKLQIIYMSMEGYKIFEYDNNKSEMRAIIADMDRKAKALGDALKTKEPPEPTSGYECEYCAHRQIEMCPIKKPKKPKQQKKFKRV